MIIRMPLLTAGLAVFLFSAPVARTQEAPCAQKFIRICDLDAANPVCKLLRPPDKAETPQSIQTFLQKLGPVESTLRKDLICARLMGSRTIENVRTNITYWRENTPKGPTRRFFFNVSSRPGKTDKWLLEMPPEYIELAKGHKELDDLKMPADKSITFHLQGQIVDVVANYLLTDLSSFKIILDSVVLLRIQTPHSSGDLKAQVVAIDKKRIQAYDEYMTTGLETTPP